MTVALKRYFGFAAFRPHQESIVRATVAGRDVFAALPTGGGKSLCYQLPAVALDRVTVVVSPLISLMKDQVDAARENGIGAAFLNSSLDRSEALEVWRQVEHGAIQLLYVSPERLAQQWFRSELSGVGVGRFAVDEAHCISEWGHEFRPEYRALGELRAAFPGVPIAAFTATATATVQRDVIEQLRLANPLVVRSSFDRREIFYAVAPKDRVEHQIAEFVQSRRGEPGIVYRSSRKATEHTADFLTAAGVPARSYHAGLTTAERARRQEAFVHDEIDVVVATIAFGMGIDKSNVRWIVHGDLPRSIEAYYQETGRAARDGEAAKALLLYGPGDIAKIRYHIDRLHTAVERERAEAQLREVLRYADSRVCRRKLLLAHFGEEHPGVCDNCDVCTGEVALEDLTVAAQKVLSAAYRTGQRFGSHHLADVVCGNATERVTVMGHDTLPTFGVGADADRSWWLSLLRDMESSGLLVRDGGARSGLTITGRGRAVLAGDEDFFAARRAQRRKRDTGLRTPTADAPGMDATEQALFERLRSLRLRIAREHGVPPYVVFSDRTLREMAQQRPVTERQMLACHGVGERKLQQYGALFLPLIAGAGTE